MLTEKRKITRENDLENACSIWWFLIKLNQTKIKPTQFAIILLCANIAVYLRSSWFCSSTSPFFTKAAMSLIIFFSMCFGTKRPSARGFDFFSLGGFGTFTFSLGFLAEVWSTAVGLGICSFFRISQCPIRLVYTFFTLAMSMQKKSLQIVAANKAQYTLSPLPIRWRSMKKPSPPYWYSVLYASASQHQTKGSCIQTKGV